MRTFRYLLGVAVLLASASDVFSQQPIDVSGRAIERHIPSEVRQSLYVGAQSGAEAVAGIASSGGTDIIRSDGAEAYRTQMNGLIVATSVSSQGRFVGVLVLNETEGERRSLALEVMDSDLSRRYRFPVRYQADDPVPSIIVRADGSSVVAHHATGRLEFVSSTGEPVAEQILARRSHDLERIIMVNSASVTGHIVVAVNEPISGADVSVAARDVRVFSSAGQEEARFDIVPRTVASLEISPSGRLIGVGAYDVPADVFETTFYDTSGAVLHRSDFTAEHIEFDGAGDTAVIADKRRLAVVEPMEAREVLLLQVESSQSLLDVSMAAEAQYVVAVSGRTQFTQTGFVHDEMRLHEFERATGDGYSHRGTPLESSAGSVRLDAETAGFGLSLDGATWWVRRY